MRQLCHEKTKTDTIKIETYWNVNQKRIEFHKPRFLIKIETYWNVNP